MCGVGEVERQPGQIDRPDSAVINREMDGRKTMIERRNSAQELGLTLILRLTRLIVPHVQSEKHLEFRHLASIL